MKTWPIQGKKISLQKLSLKKHRHWAEQKDFKTSILNVLEEEKENTSKKLKETERSIHKQNNNIKKKRENIKICKQKLELKNMSKLKTPLGGSKEN